MKTYAMNPGIGTTKGNDAGGQAGFSLLEGLIAMTILTVGLLGLAAMQTIAMTRTVDAKELGIATNLAAEMIERVHHNRRNVTAYNGFDSLIDGTAPGATQPIADGDFFQWQANLDNSGLSLVQGTVAVVATGPVSLTQSQVTIAVNWVTKTQGSSKDPNSSELQIRSRPARVTLQTVVTPP